MLYLKYLNAPAVVVRRRLSPLLAVADAYPSMLARHRAEEMTALI